ncbi:MAG: cytochrome b N-terminal domain-containing protein [Polyangiales bacterium]
MANKIGDFLDERTGFRALLSHALDEEIEGGARWAYVFGSGLLTVFICQVVTGLLLMSTYTPSMTGAWASVFYIQHKVADGWFVRGMHHYGAQAMIVVLGMHLLQVALYGAYKKPREVTWWFGLMLLGMVQGLGLTGYLLPWDQKGYWATKVATNIAGTIPVIGPSIQTLIVGGSEYGQATLTRFYVLHVGVLPAGLLLAATAHVALFRRFGATPPASADLKKKGVFYPDQLVRDVGFAVLVVLAMALLTSATHGAHLDAPSDPTVDYEPRPEWYFLFLFQLLKYLPGSLELLGTVVLPGIAGGFLFMLPFLDRGDSKRVRDRLPYLAPVLLGACGIVALTNQSLRDDEHNAAYKRGSEIAHQRAERAIMLAQKGIPVGGPLELLRSDPMTRGADLDAQHCVKCHVLDGKGERDAPDHTGFGSRPWILGMVHNPRDDHYFGKTKIDDMKPMGKVGEDKLSAVTEFLFSLGHEPQDPPFDQALAVKGKEIFLDKCLDCHVYEGQGANVLDGPDMTGYGSRTWLSRQIADGSVHYGDLNKMPTFDDDLDAHDIAMLSAFLRQQRFKVIDFKVEPAKPDAKGDAKDGDE